MSTNPDVPQVTPEQILESIRESQQLVVESVKAWREAAERVVASAQPAQPAPESPEPDALIDSSFDFAEQLLQSQREFAHELVKASMGSPKPSRPRAAAPATKASPKP
jgi:hypothetical protein